MTGFRRRRPFDGMQRRAQGAAIFQFPSLAFTAGRQQGQLVERLLKLCGGFRHRRASGGAITGLGPVGDGFFGQPGVGVMLREKLGLAFRQLGQERFQRCGDLGVQLLAGAAQ